MRPKRSEALRPTQRVSLAWRAILALMALLAVLLAEAGLARAHAELVRAEPAPGSTAPPDLTDIVLEYSEPITPVSTLILYAQGFQPVAGIELSVDGSVLTARLTEPLPAGTYTAQWTAIGLDGHPAQGSYQFAVSAAAGPSSWLSPVLVLASGAFAAGLAALLFWRRRARPSM